MRFLYIVTTYHLFQISSTLSPSSKNVCPVKWSPVDHHILNISKDAFTVNCCPDFIEKYGTCEPCPDGTYGKSCEDHCPQGYYGKQCKAECNCSSLQECHHIFGCICPVGYTGNKCDQGNIGLKAKKC
ncbi:multiple epidermal growth factor-like domains protein 10 [Mytilus trossulus]|uniref:multiple epidermal growth factor-like domains protein 10 n=1 Tax=Mytilus trossulus TaxID=6551 RepID=UPI003005E278